LASEFTITIPDWDDVIKIRPMSTLSKEEQRAKQVKRIVAMKKSPTPGIVQRLSSIANYIDDAEDILSTALVLAKPLLRRLPGRFVPGLGWILLIKDIFDFSTWLLSSATPGMTGKRNAIDQLRTISFSRGARVKKTTMFLRTAPGVGALLEGLQASETLFGVGISLGPLMGLMQDTIWGAMRGGAGDRVQFKTSTPVELHQKAAQFLLQNPMMLGFGAGLPRDDVTLINAANEYAMTWLRQHFISDQLAFNAVNGPLFGYPQLIPHKTLTREILVENGIDPDRKEPAPGPFADGEMPSLSAVHEAMLDAFPNAMRDLKGLFSDSLEGEFTAMGAIQNAEDIATWMEQVPLGSEYSPNLGDAVPIGMVELNQRLDKRTSSTDAAWFFERVAVEMAIRAGIATRNWGLVDNPLTHDWGWDPYPTVLQSDLDTAARIGGINLVPIG
jgi:hypothetical protein